MFRKLISMPVKYKLNQRFFSSCNNQCKVNELTSQLNRQEKYFEFIDHKIGTLIIMSFVNIIVSIIF